MANSYLNKIFSSNGNRRTMTISFWCKRTNAETETHIFGSGQGSVNSFVRFESSDTLKIFDYNGQSDQWIVETRRKFRDVTSWYHFHYILDTTQSTAADRVQLWVNGVRETDLNSPSYPDQNSDLNWNTSAQSWTIGGKTYGGSTTSFFEGYLAHFNFIDGTNAPCTTFGEFDSTTGSWKPRLSPSVSYGSEGFFLKFENSGAMGTDSSGNSNTFTVSGNLKQSVSTPSNTFATLDRWTHGYPDKIQYAGTGLYSYANTCVPCTSFPFVSQGKWYVEFKSETDNTSSTAYIIGMVMNGRESMYWGQIYTGGSAVIGKDASGNGGGAFCVKPNLSTPVITFNNADTNYGTQASANDIIMMAVDLNGDSSKVWFGRNGTWFNAPGTSNVGDPANGNYPGLSFTTRGEYWGVSFSSSDNQANNALKYTYVNFGEGRFGTTAISSANADGAGLGAFEYAVPSGFYSLCTKNIKDYG